MREKAEEQPENIIDSLLDIEDELKDVIKNVSVDIQRVIEKQNVLEEV